MFEYGFLKDTLMPRTGLNSHVELFFFTPLSSVCSVVRNLCVKLFFHALRLKMKISLDYL